ncbi:hypothetical protein CSKR_202014, partial [Clonorchis sinensis]
MIPAVGFARGVPAHVTTLLNGNNIPFKQQFASPYHCHEDLRFAPGAAGRIRTVRELQTDKWTERSQQSGLERLLNRSRLS